MFLIHRMSFSAFFVPLSRRYFRKEGVGFRSNVVYFRQTKFVGKRKCLSVDACATYYIDVLIFLAALQGDFQRREDFRTGTYRIRMDNTTFLRLGSAPFGSDSKVFLPIMMVFPVVNALKRFKSLGNQKSSLF